MTKAPEQIVRSIIFLLCVGSLALGLTNSVYAGAGDLDTTFGMGGKVVTDFGSDDWATAIAIQSNGKIVAVGTATCAFGGSSLCDFAVARYNSDGSLDSDFGTGGKATTDFGGDDEGHALAIQGDGKILVAGSSNGRFALARYNANGSLDATFNGSGLVLTTIASEAWATSIVIRSDGKILAGGPANASMQYALAQYAADGSLDTTFNGTGL